MQITLARIDDRLIHGRGHHRVVKSRQRPADNYLQ